jgi:preprotein translocase subunit Sss1
MEKEPQFNAENSQEEKKDNFLKKMQTTEQEMCQRILAKTEKPSEELEKRIKMLQVAEHFLKDDK